MNYVGPSEGAILAVLVLLYVAVIGLVAWAHVRIVQKAGYSGWWVLMALVPIGNLVVLCLFALQEWPVRRELEYLRGYASATGLPGYGPQPPGGPNLPPTPPSVT